MTVVQGVHGRSEGGVIAFEMIAPSESVEVPGSTRIPYDCPIPVGYRIPIAC